MKNYLHRLLAALTLVCILFSAVSCNVSTPEDTTAPIAESTAEAESPEITFNITADYCLIRPDDADPTEVKAIQLLSRGLKSACGVTCRMQTDFTKGEVVPDEFEILVGKTNRAESQKLAADLAYYEWIYKVCGENVIAICGGSPEATVTAVAAFLKDVFGYEEDSSQKVLAAGSAVPVKIPTERSYIHDYPVASIKIGGKDISDYTIVSASDKGVDLLKNGFSRLCGKNLPVVSPEEYKGGPAIFLGCAAADGSHRDGAAQSFNRYYVLESDGNIFIDFTSGSLAETAVRRFVEEFLPADAVGELTLELPEKPLTGLRVSTGTNGLVLEESSSAPIAEGITYVSELYLDKDGAPVRTYVLIVESGAARFETSMPSDSADKIGTVSNMKNQLTAAEAKGKKVIAGVNADFFDMGGSNIMRGLCVKDKAELHPAGDRPWFGVTDQGEPVIGVATDYGAYKGRLETAVGGSHVILKDGATDNLATSTEFSYTRHPRTAVGITAEGDVVIMVVDGRQPAISNGASLADLAYLLGRFGCTDAVNLDGGGSSTFLIKEASGFETKNSPSAGALRAVANGLMVVLP